MGTMTRARKIWIALFLVELLTGAACIGGLMWKNVL